MAYPAVLNAEMPADLSQAVGPGCPRLLDGLVSARHSRFVWLQGLSPGTPLGAGHFTAHFSARQPVSLSANNCRDTIYNYSLKFGANPDGWVNSSHQAQSAEENCLRGGGCHMIMFDRAASPASPSKLFFFRSSRHPCVNSWP